MGVFSQEFVEALKIILEEDSLELHGSRIIFKGRGKDVSFYKDEDGLYTVTYNGGKRGLRDIVDSLQIMKEHIHR